MSLVTRITSGLAALVVSLVAAGVCMRLWVVVQQNVKTGDPTMLLGKYRFDGSYGYLIPFAAGLVALGSCVAGVCLFLWKGDDDA